MTTASTASTRRAAPRLRYNPLYGLRWCDKARWIGWERMEVIFTQVLAHLAANEAKWPKYRKSMPMLREQLQPAISIGEWAWVVEVFRRYICDWGHPGPYVTGPLIFIEQWSQQAELPRAMEALEKIIVYIRDAAMAGE